MMKFIKGYLTSLDGIEIYPIVSLLIFFLFFVGLIVYVIRVDKKEIDIIKNIPLDEDKN